MFQTLFYQPILNLLVYLYGIIPGHDFGLAVIALTIIIKMALWPLTKQQIKGQKSLQDLQPKIEEIKKKYKDKKEEMGKAMMQLYKDNKVNPFSSCLPLIIQMPFLFAVFRVFRDKLNDGSLDLVYSFIDKPEMINYISLGYFDLSKPNVAFAILAGGAQFWQAKMMMTKKPAINTPGSKDESMMAIMNKQMLYFMPALTVFICLTFPSGLALYWLTTTVLTVAQQSYMFKKKNEDSKMIEGEIVN